MKKLMTTVERICSKSEKREELTPVESLIFNKEPRENPEQQRFRNVLLASLIQGHRHGVAELEERLPENVSIIKDSGSWMAMDDSYQRVIDDQGVNESFFDFMQRLATYGDEQLAESLSDDHEDDEPQCACGNTVKKKGQQCPGCRD